MREQTTERIVTDPSLVWNWLSTTSTRRCSSFPHCTVNVRTVLRGAWPLPLSAPCSDAGTPLVSLGGGSEEALVPSTSVVFFLATVFSPFRSVIASDPAKKIRVGIPAAINHGLERLLIAALALLFRRTVG